MNRSRRIAALVVLGLVSVFAVAAGDGLLKFAPQAGAIFKYKVTLKMTVNGQALDVVGLTTRTIVKVDTEGNVTTASKDGKPSVTVNGAKVKVPDTGEDKKESTISRPDGTLLSLGGADKSAERIRRETLETLALPAFQPAVGKSWTWVSKADAKTGAVKSKGVFKILASEVVGGTSTWKISTSVTELTGASPGSITGTQWVRKSDAVPVRCRLIGKNLPGTGIPAGTVANLNVDLVH